MDRKQRNPSPEGSEPAGGPRGDLAAFEVTRGPRAVHAPCTRRARAPHARRTGDRPRRARGAGKLHAPREASPLVARERGQRRIARAPARSPAEARTRVLLAALALLLPALAGCAAFDDARPASLPPAERRALYLTGPAGGTANATGGLSFARPTNEAWEEIPSGNFLEQWGRPAGYATFQGAPLAESLLVTGNVTVVAFARADGPATQIGQFPHVIAHFGTERALNADGSANGEPVLRPGEIVEFNFTLAVPRDGLLIERGMGPVVLLSVVMSQLGRDRDVVFLVNGTSYASRVEFDAVRVPDPSPARADDAGLALDESGTLVGSAYATTREGSSRATFELGLVADTERVLVEVVAGRAAGFGDIDLAVLDPDGEEVARSVTPLGRDAIELYAHQLGTGGPFRVAITNYGSAASEYRVTAIVQPPPLG